MFTVRKISCLAMHLVRIVAITIFLSGCATTKALDTEVPYPKFLRFNWAIIDNDNIIHFEFFASHKEPGKNNTWCASVPFEVIKQNSQQIEYKSNNGNKYFERSNLPKSQDIDRSTYEVVNESCLAYDPSTMKREFVQKIQDSQKRIYPRLSSITSPNITFHHPSHPWNEDELFVM